MGEDKKKRLFFIKGFSIKGLRKDQIAIGALVGILLLVIAIPVDKKDKKKQETISAAKEEEASLRDNTSGEDYAKQLEKRLEEALSSVSGVGEVKVMITLKDNGVSVVEKDKPQTQSKVKESDSNGGTRETTESNWDESTIYIESSTEKTPYEAGRKSPKIEGVLVIAQGASQASVRTDIYDAVQALFSIEIHKIKVMKRIAE